MKVLFVASHKENYPHHVTPFVGEQGEALRKAGVEVEYFTIKGKGVKGYLSQIEPLKNVIKEFRPDVLHAHYGMSGLLANMQRRVPVVTTYHGSDINEKKARLFSIMAIALSKHNIFVSNRLIKIAKPKRNYSLLPCGVNVADFPIMDRAEARKRLGLDLNQKYILFAGAFENYVKNSALAKEAMALLPNMKLLEMKGYSRAEVAALYYGCDAFLMTSLSEGSPQVIKEAMVCGCPIVSVDVGDVAERILKVTNCAVVERNPQAIAEKLRQILDKNQRSNGREKLLEMGIDNTQVAEKLRDIYRKILH